MPTSAACGVALGIAIAPVLFVLQRLSRIMQRLEILRRFALTELRAALTLTAALQLPRLSISESGCYTRQLLQPNLAVHTNDTTFYHYACATQ